MSSAHTYRTMSLVVTAMVGLGSTLDSAAQSITSPSRRSQPSPAVLAGQNVSVVQPDLIAGKEGPPSSVESYSEQNPCVPHTHTSWIRVELRGRFVASSLPTSVATLQRDGQQIDSWQSIAAGQPPIILGRFSWTWLHNCPDGTTTVTFSEPPPLNVRFVVDPAGQLAEASEANNVLEFHVPPDAVWTRSP